MFFTRAIEFLTKQQHQEQEACFEVADHSCPTDFQTLQGIVAQGWLLEALLQSLVLKKPHTSQTNPRRHQMELAVKAPSWGLILMVPEGNMQGSNGESQPTVLPSYDTYEPQQRWP